MFIWLRHFHSLMLQYQFNEFKNTKFDTFPVVAQYMCGGGTIYVTAGANSDHWAWQLHIVDKPSIQLTYFVVWQMSGRNETKLKSSEKWKTTIVGILKSKSHVKRKKQETTWPLSGHFMQTSFAISIWIRLILNIPYWWFLQT